MKIVEMCLTAPEVTLILSAVILARVGSELYFALTRPSGIPCSMGFLLASGGLTLKGLESPHRRTDPSQTYLHH